MTKAIRFHATGGAPGLRRAAGRPGQRREDAEPGEPGPGEVRIRNAAIAVNYRDILVRRGTHRVALPSGLGLESAGVIEAIGPQVSGLAIGQRGACGAGPDGAYAQARLPPAPRGGPPPAENDAAG